MLTSNGNMQRKTNYQDNRQRVMLGNEAIARGLIENGCSVAASYPGTPASEIFEEIFTSVYNKIEREASQSTKGVMSGAKKAFETLKGLFIK